jgi:hypothetical protein
MAFGLVIPHRTTPHHTPQMSYLLNGFTIFLLPYWCAFRGPVSQQGRPPVPCTTLLAPAGAPAHAPHPHPYLAAPPCARGDNVLVAGRAVFWVTWSISFLGILTIPLLMFSTKHHHRQAGRLGKGLV